MAGVPKRNIFLPTVENLSGTCYFSGTADMLNMCCSTADMLNMCSPSHHVVVIVIVAADNIKYLVNTWQENNTGALW